MNIYLDDIRFPRHPEGVTIIRSYEDFVFTWKHNKQQITDISFDHDLGYGKTGYDAICLVEADYHNGVISHYIEMYCHSANPVGAQRIIQVIKNIEERRDNA